MRVLIACEYSGRVRDAFIAQGHDAMSCDLEPTEVEGPHYQGDIRGILYDGWDMMIAFPPCTYLARSGARWWKDPGRAELADQAAEFVFLLRDAPIYRIAIENPIGQLNKRWRYPDQSVQPYMFGDPYRKTTCLWLKNLPPLMATLVCPQYQPWIDSNVGTGKKLGQQWSRGKARNWKERSRTFQGIANAMSVQWGGLLS